MPECIGGFIGVFITIVFLCTLIAVVAYALTKNPDMGCTYDCKNCPFPECTDDEKKFMQSRYGDNSIGEDDGL